MVHKGLVVWVRHKGVVGWMGAPQGFGGVGGYPTMAWWGLHYLAAEASAYSTKVRISLALVGSAAFTSVGVCTFFFLTTKR